MLSTEATARSGAFSRAISALAPGTAVLETGTGLLVPLAESGRTDYSDAGVREAVRTSLSPLLGSGIDTLVLGCTHFPLLAGAIGEAAGPGVELVNSGAAGAMECARLLEGGGLLCGRDSGGHCAAWSRATRRSLRATPNCFCPMKRQYASKRLDSHE